MIRLVLYVVLIFGVSWGVQMLSGRHDATIFPIMLGISALSLGLEVRGVALATTRKEQS